MNSKMLLAFAGGLIVASGVTYVAMRRTPAPVETAAAPAQTAPAAQTPTVLPPTEPEPATDQASGPEASKPSPAPVQQPQVSRAAERAHPKSAAPARDASAAGAQTTPPAPTTETPAPVQPAPQQQARVEPVPAPRVEPPPPPPPKPASVTVPRGTILTVRLGETLSSEKNNAGDQFSAVLDQPFVVDGFVIAERGAKVQGRVVELERSGRVKGVAKMALELTHLHTADGQNVRINTTAYTRQAESTTKRDAAKVGIGAAIGAAIGAIAGGGKGAGIGAGVGGAAGAGDVLLTRGQPAEVRVETRLSFRLSEPVTLTERLRQ